MRYFSCQPSIIFISPCLFRGGPRIPLPTPSRVLTNARDLSASICLLAKRSPPRSRMLCRLPCTYLFTDNASFLALAAQLNLEIQQYGRSSSLNLSRQPTKPSPQVSLLLPLHGLFPGPLAKYSLTTVCYPLSTIAEASLLVS